MTSLYSLCGGGGVGCKPNLVKCFGPRLRLWTWTLDFVLGPSFSIRYFILFEVNKKKNKHENLFSDQLAVYVEDV